MGAGHAVTDIQVMEDCMIDQGWENYSEAEHKTWGTLFDRQVKTLQGQACDEYYHGLETLGITGNNIPDFRRMNERLYKATGWEVVAVPGLISSKPFFQMLSERKFPAGNFIRKPEEMDYLEEPDIFHDVFGHIPLLTNPAYANYMEAYGKGGAIAMENKGVKFLARLNWYTIEFGMIQKGDDLKIYGAGIVSSYGETKYCLEDPSSNKIAFDLERVLRTGYYIDDFQATYFVVKSFEELFEQCIERPFLPLYNELREKETLTPFDIVDSDDVISQGSGEYWKDFPQIKSKLK